MHSYVAIPARDTIALSWFASGRRSFMAAVIGGAVREGKMALMDYPDFAVDRRRCPSRQEP